MKQNESGTFGFTSECKKCLGARNLKWSKTEAGRARAKRYRDAHPESALKAQGDTLPQIGTNVMSMREHTA